MVASRPVRSHVGVHVRRDLETIRPGAAVDFFHDSVELVQFGLPAGPFQW